MKKDQNKGKYDKTIVIPVEKSMWKSLRIISFQREMSMCELAREGFQKIINKYEKSIDTD